MILVAVAILFGLASFLVPDGTLRIILAAGSFVLGWWALVREYREWRNQ
jgi:hypothetical protein